MTEQQILANRDHFRATGLISVYGTPQCYACGGPMDRDQQFALCRACDQISQERDAIYQVTKP